MNNIIDTMDTQTKEHFDAVDTWQQGRFIDHKKYDKLPQEWKDEQDAQERLFVKAKAEGNILCQVMFPEYAKWIADRLNKLSKIETMVLDGDKAKEIIQFIKK